MGHVIEVNRLIRNLRAEKSVPAGTRLEVHIRSGDYRSALAETAAATAFTSRVEPQVGPPDAELPEGEFAFGRIADTEVALALPQVDEEAEKARLEKELAEAEAHGARLRGQLGNEKFIAKAPDNVIAGVRNTLSETEKKVNGLRERLGLSG